MSCQSLSLPARQFRPGQLLLPFLLILIPPLASSQSSTLVHHSLDVVLDPLGQSIEVTDTITLPATLEVPELEFELNSNLRVSASSSNLTPAGSRPGSGFVGGNSTGGLTADANRFRLQRPADGRLVISYAGRIHQQAVQNSAEYAQSFAETSGIISADGVYLNAASLWVPDFGTDLLSFDLEVEFVGNASSWTAVSQGSRPERNRWQESLPMEEIYLIAADFTEYSASTGAISLHAFLRTPDRNLANRYLEAAERYMALYQPLLGEYPFSKFALVENFWETGYGMPSFTLLGEQVIRFPFILDSSYPHEILHNWWGNGVYPDYGSGNWSEGLTAYLADHLFQEMNNLGADYRRDNLIRYRNYVAEESDFPLREFTSRNSAATQAVGYGKSLMLWHMLRMELGDTVFLDGLRAFYGQYQFRRAGFADIAAVFSMVAGRDLQGFFSQWVDRVGAPAFQLSVAPDSGDSGRIMFAQVQDGAPYALSMPVALYYAGEPVPRLYNIPLSQKFEGVAVDSFSRLQAVVVDPYFDVFRTLHREEIPPTIGQLFGSGKVALVLPEENRESWRQLAEAFSVGVDASIVVAEELETLPADRSVWVLGRDNRFTPLVIDSLMSYGVELQPMGVAVAGSLIDFAGRSTVLTARHPGNPELALGWIHIDDMIALPGMVEKLPHYGKYSYLSFTGSEPTNDVKGNWSSRQSPMQWFAPGSPTPASLPALPPVAPLTQLPPKYLPERLQQHVQALTAEAMSGRRIGSAGNQLAAQYIAGQFEAIGLQSPTGGYIQEWTGQLPDGSPVTLRNVVGILPGSDPVLAASPAILGAHFDHLGVRSDSAGATLFTGADDNASGVSVLLEVAAALSGSFSPRRSIIFVAFDGEEAGLLGSAHFVQAPSSFARENLFAMVNLDSVGRLDGRDLQVFGSASAYEWPFMAQGIGFTIGLNSTMVPQTVAGSDHVSFLNAGIPAIHVFSGVHEDYHQPGDLADKLDYQGMSEIARWVEEAMVFLSDREAPLRVNLGGASVPVSETAGTERQASLGSVPDFAYSGQGVRLGGVTPGGAAETAGLQVNDVLLRFNNTEITDLQSYSDLIRASAPGDTVQLQVLRGGQIMTVQVTLRAR